MYFCKLSEINLAVSRDLSHILIYIPDAILITPTIAKLHVCENMLQNVLNSLRIIS